MNQTRDPRFFNCQNGWYQYEGNPIVGVPGDYCFDPCVLDVGACRRMYVSWKQGERVCVACCDSADGIRWQERTVVLSARENAGWEEDLNRACVLYREGRYHMWYTAQTGLKNRSYEELYEASGEEGAVHAAVGYATSEDGLRWNRLETPVMTATQPWEKHSVMCSEVQFDPQRGKYRMWYSGGSWLEPDAIGYAESEDGVVWVKHPANPVFTPAREHFFEREKTIGSTIVRTENWHYLFYIGMEDVFKARLCLARSKDGVTGWERHARNPILSLGLPGTWNCESVYKPSLYYEQENDRWLLYVNGRAGVTERIGLYFHPGRDFWNEAF